jgi:hypothetical protein
MSFMVRLGLSLLLLAAISSAQNTCAAEGFAGANSLDGIRAATGVVRVGSLSTNALLLQPMVAEKPYPPVLFSYSEIKIADSRTKLLSIAMRLAKDGAAVMILERTFVWDPQNDPVERDPRLLDCASDWLTLQKNVEFFHTTFIGPQVRDGSGKLRPHQECVVRRIHGEGVCGFHLVKPEMEMTR